MEKQWKQWHFIFLGSKITAGCDWSHEIKKCLLLGRKAMTNLDSILKSRDVTLPTKVYSQMSGFSSSYIRMWEMDNKKAEHEELTPSHCGAGEDSWESLGKQGDQSSQSERKSTLNIHWKDWYWSSNTWSPDVKSWLIRKDPGVGNGWRREEKKAAEDEMDR